MNACQSLKALSIFVALLAADTSWAGPPDPAHSQLEPVVVGDSNGMQIGDGYRVVVRDINGNPLNGITVELRFPGSGANPYNQQVPPAIPTCIGRLISSTTDATGTVVFRPRFGGFENSAGITVKGNSINLGSVRARSTDIDSDGATAINDLNRFRLNFLTAPGNLETDFDESGSTEIGDLSIFRRVFLFDTPGMPCP